MSDVRIVEVSSSDDGIRLDKWFKANFPEIPFGNLQKLMRTGQIRVDGGRVKSGMRLETGQKIRVPPIKTLPDLGKVNAKPSLRSISKIDLEIIQRSVLHRDDNIIVINKPAGLAVQGGSGTSRHVDGMLDGLRFESPERPKLVHRLDKDTSGVLVLARNSKSARRLTELFRTKDIRKLYWALSVGVPNPGDGLIDLRLIKSPGRHGEQMAVDEINGKRAKTRYKVLDQAGRRVSLLSLEPLTGRTHQLRVHLANALATPIVGDGKYGGNTAFLDGGGIEKKLHLHARRILIPVTDREFVDVTAPISEHFRTSLEYLGFYIKEDYDRFLDLD